MRVRLAIAVLVLIVSSACSGRAAFAAQSAPLETAHQLMKDVIYNELHDQEKYSFWQYRSHVVTAKKDILREQIETDKGPVYLILARDGQQLQGTSAQKEQERLAAYVNNPGAIAKVLRSHQSDENRLAQIMKLIPDAYVFQYEGPATGPEVRLSFAPNPHYKPSTYADRIMCGLSGQIVVNQTLKRLISMSGTIRQKIDFGFGILGYVDPGGTFTIHRIQVSPKHWKTDLVDVHVQGRVLLFSNVSKVERETRWDFLPVPHNITLQQAVVRLERAAAAYQAQMENASLMKKPAAQDAIRQR